VILGTILQSRKGETASKVLEKREENLNQIAYSTRRLGGGEGNDLVAAGEALPT